MNFVFIIIFDMLGIWSRKCS